jgi:hypothetical protein
MAREVGEYIRAILENLISRYNNSLASGCTNRWLVVVVFDLDSAAVSVDNWDFMDAELGLAK